MSATKMVGHTPGPWTAIVGTNAKGQQLPPRIIRQGKAGIIATLGIPDAGDRDANARLIASAPKMLEALASIAINTHDAQSRDRARAAIAEAEGRDQ